MASDKSFYMVLPSNVASYADNKISNYKTLLPRHIALTGDWEVGLTEISFPKSWYTISENTEISIMTSDLTDPLSWGGSLVVSKGIYSNELKLAETITDLVKTKVKLPSRYRDYNIEEYPEIYYDPKEFKFRMKVGRLSYTHNNEKRYTYICLAFEEPLGSLLGFPGKDFWTKLQHLRIIKKVPENVLSYAQQSQTWHAIMELFAKSFTLSVIPLKFESLKEPDPLLGGHFQAQIWKFNWKPSQRLTKITEVEHNIPEPKYKMGDDYYKQTLGVLNGKIKTKLESMSYTVAPYISINNGKFTHNTANISNGEELLIFLPEALDKRMGVIGTSGETWNSLLVTSKEFCLDDPENLIPKTDPIWSGFARLWRGLDSPGVDYPITLPASSLSEFATFYQHVYIYSDIVSPVYVGDTYSQLLRVCHVPVEVPFGEQIVQRFEKPYYLKVATSEFGSIEIHIKGDDDKSVPFEFGTSIATLHFRQVK